MMHNYDKIAFGNSSVTKSGASARQTRGKSWEFEEELHGDLGEVWRSFWEDLDGVL